MTRSLVRSVQQGRVTRTLKSVEAARPCSRVGWGRGSPHDDDNNEDNMVLKPALLLAAQKTKLDLILFVLKLVLEKFHKQSSLA